MDGFHVSGNLSMRHSLMWNLTKRCLLCLMMIQLTEVIAIFAISSNSGNSTWRMEEMKEVVVRLLADENHTLIRPNAGGKPTTIKVNLEVVYIGDFQEADMVFTLELYFRQYWQDIRLTFTKLDSPITLPGELSESLWQPDTFFENGKKGELHKLTSLNKAMRVYPNGEVFVSTRITLSCLCAMDFRKFPMDRQVCDLYFYSYAFTDSDIVYTWGKEKVIWSKQQEIAQFELRSVTVFEKSREYVTGNYSLLGVRFVFVRRIGHYLTRVYIPAALVVCLSWLSFYVDRASIPARVSLGVTTVLTMTTLLIGIGQGSLPVVSYVKAVDWYLIVCYTLVFGAFAEYAVISYIEKKPHCCQPQRPASSQKMPEEGPELNGDPFACISSHQTDIYDDNEPRTIHQYGLFNWSSLICKWRKQSLDCHILEECTRMIFIFAFITFNVFYWWYYMYYDA